MKFLLLLLFPVLTQAQTATINDFAMLVGTWSGTGFNSDLTEVWSAPSSGSMMGMFKMEKDGEVIIYEFMDIAKEDGIFRMSVKHFNSDMTGWEEKDKFESFTLVKTKENEIVFEGLTIKKTGKNTLVFLLLVGSKDGSSHIEEIKYTRVN